MQVASNRLRSKKGSIVEFGPALFIMLVIFFFPLINLFNIGTIYLCAYTLNDLQVQAASQRPQSEGADKNGFVQKDIPEAWAATGIGRFVKLISKPETEVTYSELLPGSKDKIVDVTTTVIAGSFMEQPYVPQVPGLSAPMRLVFHAERVMERSVESDGDDNQKQ
jgi:hypothetical protein